MIDDDEYCIDVLTQIVVGHQGAAGRRPRPARRARPPLRARRGRRDPRGRRRQGRRGGAGGRAPPPRLTSGDGGAPLGPLADSYVLRWARNESSWRRDERPHHERGEDGRDRRSRRRRPAPTVLLALDVVERRVVGARRRPKRSNETSRAAHHTPINHEPSDAPPARIAARGRRRGAPPQVLHDQHRDHEVGERDEPGPDRPPGTERGLRRPSASLFFAARYIQMMKSTTITSCVIP